MEFSIEARLEIEISSSLLSLRELNPLIWTDMAGKARAEIMSCHATGRCDAYLLSKGSLFVFDHKLVMLSSGYPSLKDAAMVFLGMVAPGDIDLLCYQRRSAAQPPETEQLPEFRGEVVALWMALNADIDRTLFLDDRHEFCTFLYNGPSSPKVESYVLQIAMSGLASSVCESFEAGFVDPERLYDRTGILKLVIGFHVEDRFFEGSTYSLNAVSGGRYSAIHVSFDPKRSAASFETNDLDEDGWSDTITAVLDAFKPSRFACFLIEPDGKRSEIEMPYLVEERTSCTILDNQHVKLLAYERRTPSFL